MKDIPQEVVEYLKTQHIAVLAVEMLDGSPHAATVHFAHTDNPFVFYFETHRVYRKAESIMKNDKTRASLVVGMTDSDMKTLQLDGYIEKITDEERSIFDDVYFRKFPDKLKKYTGPDNILFKLTPIWWRFTDWRTSEGKKIWTSDVL